MIVGVGVIGVGGLAHSCREGSCCPEHYDYDGCPPYARGFGGRPIVDVDRLDRNIDRMARYAAVHGLALRPHTKVTACTHARR
jgi:hypothetical protein